MFQIKSIATMCALVTTVCLSSSTWAGDVEFEQVGDSKDARIAQLEAELAALNGSDRVSGVAGLTFLNERNARGMVLEDQGLITQGLLGVNFFLAEEVSLLKNLTLITGVWVDIHSNSDGPGPSAASAGAGTPGTNLSSFYEFDWWVGMSFEIGSLNVTAYYEEFLNPSDDFVAMTAGFESSHVQTVFTYDGLGDGLFGLNENVNLNPHVRLLFECDGSVGPTADDGVYIELGVAPSFTLIDSVDAPVTLSIPVTVGLGANDFYENDEELGYVSVGVTASMPLPMLAEWGNWTMTTGVSVIDGNDDAVGAFNSNVAGQSDDTRVVGFISFGLGF